MTPFSAGRPSDANTAAFSAHWWSSDDAKLWASGSRFYGGGNKVLWERPGNHLSVRGHLLGSSAGALGTSIPSGYNQFTYQASGLDFDRPGCWEVTASAATIELRFIVYVYPASYRVGRGSCVNLADTIRNSEVIVVADAEGTSPALGTYVARKLRVVSNWKGDRQMGRTAQVLQDSDPNLSLEAQLEEGKRYVVFLAGGGPEGMRLHCPWSTLAEVRADSLIRPARYRDTRPGWIWGKLTTLARPEAATRDVLANPPASR